MDDPSEGRSFAESVSRRRWNAGRRGSMQAHSQLMLVGRAGHSQLIPVEKHADCRSGRFRLQVVTARFPAAQAIRQCLPCRFSSLLLTRLGLYRETDVWRQHPPMQAFSQMAAGDTTACSTQKRWRSAARRCLTVGAAWVRVCCSIQAAMGPLEGGCRHRPDLRWP